ncbi:MAG: hypothetical protein ACRD3D_15055 [Terriglobia bacterium]
MKRRNLLVALFSGGAIPMLKASPRVPARSAAGELTAGPEGSREHFRGRQRTALRLGGPVFKKSGDPGVIAEAHHELGYRAAYAPAVNCPIGPRSSRSSRSSPLAGSSSRK